MPGKAKQIGNSKKGQRFTKWQLPNIFQDNLTTHDLLSLGYLYLKLHQIL